ncbi:hypothetical protein BKA69DRAFT_1080096, partial [Paraphysoderma sedebokerense]
MKSELEVRVSIIRILTILYNLFSFGVNSYNIVALIINVIFKLSELKQKELNFRTDVYENKFDPNRHLIILCPEWAIIELIFSSLALPLLFAGLLGAIRRKPQLLKFSVAWAIFKLISYFVIMTVTVILIRNQVGQIKVSLLAAVLSLEALIWLVVFAIGFGLNYLCYSRLNQLQEEFGRDGNYVGFDRN